jgi:protein-S-isoprenylcysteine O-methyltransferase Ste14
MKNPVIDWLLQFNQRKFSTTYKLASLLGGMLVFLIIIPFLILYVGTWSGLAQITGPRWLELCLALVGMPVGLFFLTWSTWTQWQRGEGTPALNAPPQKLIISGPYCWCRNPIELGALLYYLGMGALLQSWATGVMGMVVLGILGSSYHKFVEEKELAARFGQDYLEYRRTTPFLIPWFWKKK